MKNALMVLCSLLVSVGLIEVACRIDNFFISSGLIFDFPQTKLRKNALKSRNLIPLKSAVKYLRVNGKRIRLIMSPIFRPADNVDKLYGAIDIFHYHEGFCNEVDQIEQPTIISVGDSFTYCTAVEIGDAWPKRIGHPSVPKSDRLNLGMPGRGPSEYVQILKSRLSAKTQFIVVAIYEGNDLRDVVKTMPKPISAQAQAMQAKSSSANHTSVFKKFGRFLGDYLYLPNIVWATVKKLDFVRKQFLLPQGRHNFHYGRLSDAGKIEFNVNNIDLDEVDFAYLVNSGEIKQDDIQKYWEIEMARMADLAMKYSASILFLYLPSAYTAFGDLTTFEDKNIGQVVRKFSKKQRQAFERICKINQLSCLDLVSEFQKYNASNVIPSHFPSNLHLTLEGHGVIASAVNKYCGFLEFAQNGPIKNSVCGHIPTDSR